MGKGLPRSLSRGNPLIQPIIKDTIVVRDVQLTINGSSGAGFGTAVIGDFPEGNICLIGAVAYLQFSGSGSDADLANDWEGDFSIGSSPTGDNSLSGNEINIIPSAAIGAATNEASPVVRSTGTGIAILNNIDNAVEINLNMLIDDADIAGNDSVITVNGEVYVLYSMLGDSEPSVVI